MGVMVSGAGVSVGAGVTLDWSVDGCLVSAEVPPGSFCFLSGQSRRHHQPQQCARRARDGVSHRLTEPPQEIATKSEQLFHLLNDREHWHLVSSSRPSGGLSQKFSAAPRLTGRMLSGGHVDSHWAAAELGQLTASLCRLWICRRMFAVQGLSSDAGSAEAPRRVSRHRVECRGMLAIKIGLVGAGRMATALARGFVAAKLVPASALVSKRPASSDARGF